MHWFLLPQGKSCFLRRIFLADGRVFIVLGETSTPLVSFVRLRVGSVETVAGCIWIELSLALDLAFASLSSSDVNDVLQLQHICADIHEHDSTGSSSSLLNLVGKLIARPCLLKRPKQCFRSSTFMQNLHVTIVYLVIWLSTTKEYSNQ